MKILFRILRPLACKGRIAAIAAAVVLLIGLFVGVAEIALRYLGLVDFPLYDVDAHIGYIPKASQHGWFMRDHEYRFNSLSMGAAEFDPSATGNVLLIGDSLVLGGNPYAGPERLGPQLQSRLKPRVWPIAAGSWSLQNELTWIEDHPEVLAQVQTLAFVINSGDFDKASSWSCSWTHPRQRPAVALVYLARKYVLHSPCEGTPAVLQVPPRDPLPMLRALMAQRAGSRVVFFLYPDVQEAADPALMASRLEAMAVGLRSAGVSEVVSVGRDARWRVRLALYRDGIHPTPEGMATLAAIMADTLK